MIFFSFIFIESIKIYNYLYIYFISFFIKPLITSIYIYKRWLQIMSWHLDSFSNCFWCKVVTSFKSNTAVLCLLIFFVQIHYTTPFLFFSAQHYHLRNRETGINKVIFIFIFLSHFWLTKRKVGLYLSGPFIPYPVE